MATLSELSEKMLQGIIDDDWVDPDRISAVVTRAIEIAEARGAEYVLPFDLAEALNEEISRAANADHAAVCGTLEEKHEQ